ncbi:MULTISPECIES: hypothetical protein [unclassified Haloferax]|uniref:hypothetical protein n=1 Tax=unclassified Haloferax TaxID=2625095 RepID=UPI0011C0838C|nr:MULTISPECIES: hypothetical protein [unclassified Haloferax]
MAKHTTRDKIWSTALHVAHSRKDREIPADREFGHREVMESLDVEVSEKTVRDCLQSIRSEGWLRSPGTGIYHAPGAHD